MQRGLCLGLGMSARLSYQRNGTSRHVRFRELTDTQWTSTTAMLLSGLTESLLAVLSDTCTQTLRRRESRTPAESLDKNALSFIALVR